MSGRNYVDAGVIAMYAQMEKVKVKSKRIAACSRPDNKAGSNCSLMIDKRPTSVMQQKQQQCAMRAPIVQRVLQDPANAAREARLIGEYHAAEAAGDADRDDAAAIQQYQIALAKRREVNNLHIAVDDGHRGAIEVLRAKIVRRRVAIQRARAVEVARENRRRQREAVARRDAAPDGRGAPAAAMGTADQASWITGVSAWQPRPRGT
ncbi:MAG: hypothetical protein KUG80_00560 [Gammaproteobacteria bacterium]|nr:hypothetical protein [Gammaproteobacteria bacterium]